MTKKIVVMMFKPLTSHQTKHTALKFVDAGSLLFTDHFS